LRVVVLSEHSSIRRARDLARRKALGPRAVGYCTFPGRLVASDAVTESPRRPPDAPTSLAARRRSSSSR
jgi:hypothetical protein